MSEQQKQPAVIFQSPETAKAVIAVVTGKRPIGWSRKSRSSYYNKDYAMQIKPAIDEQLKTGKDIFYPWDAFCDPKKVGSVSIVTLYHKINQSIRFIVEKMDNDGKYANWYAGVHITKSEGYGLKISMKPTGPQIIPHMMTARTEMPRWQREFDEWLESDNVEPFVREGLALTQDEVIAFTKQVEDLSSIIANVTSSQIQIVKVGSE